MKHGEGGWWNTEPGARALASFPQNGPSTIEILYIIGHRWTSCTLTEA